MSKSEKIWISVLIVVGLAIAAWIYWPEDEVHDFVGVEVVYTAPDESTGSYSPFHVGYEWISTIGKDGNPSLIDDSGNSAFENDDYQKIMDVSSPDNTRKFPWGLGLHNDVIPNSAANEPLTLEFEKKRSAPDNVTVYAFDETFAYDDRLYTENATEVFDLGGGKRTYTIENPTPETSYWVKATWGEEYIVYLIPITDLEISTLYDYS